MQDYSMNRTGMLDLTVHRSPGIIQRMPSRLQSFLHTLGYALILFLELLLLAAIIGPNTVLASDQLASIRRYTRPYEFNFVEWDLNAIAGKWDQAALGTIHYVPVDQRSEIVLAYFDIVQHAWEKENAINLIFADPKVSDPSAASAELRQELAALVQKRDTLRPLAEAVLESQVSQVAADLGLTLGGQPLPPVLYHTTNPPNSLIISPRNVIRQERNLNIAPDMNIEEIVKLEDDVSHALDVSTLTVGIGGIGLYPTMVMETTNINWLAEVVSHEWTHNYLMARPLGALYDITPDNRIINETTAAIAGKEMGQVLIARYYPQFVPQPASQPGTPAQPGEPPAFDFRAEMHTTRLEADRLLAAGQIDEAEAYMEARRLVFWDHGYRIRKLNQAYFAFYGAYADQPGGAAGEDPVSAAVRTLRQQSPSLASFINRIGWIWNYQQLIRITAKN